MRVILIIIFNLMFAYQVAGTELVRCKGTLYTLDYLLNANQPPYGEIFADKDMQVGTFPYMIIFIALYNRFAPELEGPYKMYLQNFMSGDQYISWQEHSLPFPSKKVDGKALGLDSSCLNARGEAEILTAVKKTQQGELVAYEYDSKLVRELKASNTQYSFFLNGTFFRNYVAEYIDLSQLNYLFHTLKLIGTEPTQVRSEIVRFGLVYEQVNGICQRSLYVKTAIEREVGLPCEEVSGKDLIALQKLSIEGQGWNSQRFVPGDFLFLKNLASLSINNVRMYPAEISEDDIKELSSLKMLTFTNNEINETPKNFMDNLSGLTYLDLSLNNIFELKHDAFRNVFVKLNNAPEVVMLNLSGNTKMVSPRSNTYIHEGAFNNCEAVTDLNLSDMNIVKINSSVFDPFVRLKRLDLSKNYLLDFIDILQSPSLSSLEELSIASTVLGDMLFENEFQYMKSLRKLILGPTRLKEFPEFLLKLPALKEITFCGIFFPENRMAPVRALVKSKREDIKFNEC